jgi:hypothetical protein
MNEEERELKSEVYLCSDCGLETNHLESSEMADELLPDKLCQLCLMDLLSGRYAGGPVEKHKQKNAEDTMIDKVFGLDDKRTVRKGSSQANIDYIKNREKKHVRY